MDNKVDQRQRVISSLNPKTLALLEEVETFAGVEIEFTKHEGPPGHTEASRDSPVAIANHKLARIAIRQKGKIDPKSILHELLHIHRSWVQGIPRFVVVAGAPRELQEHAADIDNQLEHYSAIIEAEEDYGYPRGDYWSKVFRQVWREWPWRDLRKAPLRYRSAVLLDSLFLDVVPDKDIAKRAAFCIEQALLRLESQRFREAALEVRADKRRLVSRTIEFLNLDASSFELVTFDIRRRLYDSVPMDLGGYDRKRERPWE